MLFALSYLNWVTRFSWKNVIKKFIASKLARNIYGIRSSMYMFPFRSRIDRNKCVHSLEENANTDANAPRSLPLPSLIIRHDRNFSYVPWHLDAVRVAAKWICIYLKGRLKRERGEEEMHVLQWEMHERRIIHSGRVPLSFLFLSLFIDSSHGTAY